MSIVSIQEQKAHMNVDFDDDDDLIAAKIDASESHIAALIGLNLVDMTPFPGALREAIQMLAAHFYENREATTVDGRANEMPFGFMTLVTPYRAWGF